MLGRWWWWLTNTSILCRVSGLHITISQSIHNIYKCNLFLLFKYNQTLFHANPYWYYEWSKSEFVNCAFKPKLMNVDPWWFMKLCTLVIWGMENKIGYSLSRIMRKSGILGENYLINIPFTDHYWAYVDPSQVTLFNYYDVAS